jgi:tetratricopeptide (TPR) repeat protein
MELSAQPASDSDSRIQSGMRALVASLLIVVSAAGQTRPDRAALLQRGAKLVAANQLSAAEDLYKNGLHHFPGDADLQYELGMVFFRQRKWPQAIENYIASLKAKPGQVKPLFYLAESYYMQSDLDHARQTIAEAARIAPDDAQVCQKYGEYLSAGFETRKVGLARLEKARQLNAGLLRIDFEIGKTQFQLTDYPLAVTNFEAALKRNPNDGEAAFYLAESSASLGDWAKARDSYAYALAHGYAHADAYYGLGKSRVELADCAAALDPLVTAISMQPSLVNVHFQLARAYRQLGQTKNADEQLRLFAAVTDRVDTSQALRDPEEQQAWAQVKPLLRANKEEEALELLAKSPIGGEPDRGGALYLLGVMYQSLGRTDDAKRVLALAQAQNPQSARIPAYLGMVRLSTGQASSAEAAFQSALALDSSEALALIGMGGIRYQQGRWQEAIDDLEKSRTADPNTLLMLCDAYYQAGQPQQAALTAEVVRALGADNKTVLGRLDALLVQHAAGRTRLP